MQPSTGTRDQQRRAKWVGTGLVAQGDVCGQASGRGRVQRYQPGLGELGFADDQQLLIVVEIGGVQRNRLTDPQTAGREQTD